MAVVVGEGGRGVAGGAPRARDGDEGLLAQAHQVAPDPIRFRRAAVGEVLLSVDGAAGCLQR